MSSAHSANSGAFDWGKLDGLGPAQTYPAGMELLRQGARPPDVYLIEQGVVKLIHSDEEGRSLIVDLRFPGWLLGAASVILDEPCLVTAVTLTPCRLRRIRADDFLHLTLTSREWSWGLNQVLSRGVHDQVVHSCGLGLQSARRRLEHFLWKAALSMGGIEGQRPLRLQLPLNHSELAELMAVTESYLSRLLKRLEKAGLLRQDRGWLIIPDPEKLWHSADLSVCSKALSVAGSASHELFHVLSRVSGD